MTNLFWIVLLVFALVICTSCYLVFDRFNLRVQSPIMSGQLNEDTTSRGQ